MIWFGVLVAFYAFFELFRSNDGLGLALALARLSLALVYLCVVKFHGGLMVSGAFFISVVMIIGAMVIMRKEVQIKNDQR